MAGGRNARIARVAPTLLASEDAREVLITCRSDWTLEWAEASPGGGWRQPFDYEVDGGSWVARDASMKNPFNAAIGRALAGWAPQGNDSASPLAWRCISAMSS